MMDNLTSDVGKLVKKDQENIGLFRQNKISQDDLARESEKISEQFLEILKKSGFPYKNIVSNDIYKAGITLSLHLKLDDLKSVYKNFIEHVYSDKVAIEHKVIFIDKIKILSGEPQLYGSQYKINENGKKELLPVFEPDNLDLRRKELGLCSVSEYLNTN